MTLMTAGVMPVGYNGVAVLKQRNEANEPRQNGVFRQLPPPIRVWYEMEESWRADVVPWRCRRN